MKLIKHMLFFTVLISITGCGLLDSVNETEVPALRFDPKLTMYDAGVVTFNVGVANESGVDAPPLNQADIDVVVTDEAGEVRNQMYLADLTSIPAGESVHPLIYEASYKSGFYTMSITGETLPDLTLNFRIEAVDGVPKLVAHPDWIDPYTAFTVTDPDL